ncbi:MAG: aminotransferase class V-fold PLP-dependent enzyme [Saprospiraceae bacterium]
MDQQRDKFYLPEDVVYLNNAFMAPNLKAVEAAGHQGVSRKNLPFDIKIDDFFKPVEKVKQSFSKIINNQEIERIAIIPSVSYGIASVARNIKPKSYGNIVVAAEQFPSNFYAWKRFADTYDLQIRTVRPPETLEKGKGWNQAIIENIDKQTVVVAIGNVHWADGTLFDLKPIRRACDENQVYLVIDGTQSVGALPINVNEIQPDALICAGYKWLFGPYSMGLAYYGPKFDNGIPIEENWINRKGSENFQALVNYEENYHPLARKYNMGECSNFISIPMMQAALDQINEWTVEKIAAYTKALVDPFLDDLSRIGGHIEDPAYRSNHLFGIKLHKHFKIDKIKEAFAARNIYVSFRGNSMRVSTHLYNRPKDFEILLDTLKACE